MSCVQDTRGTGRAGAPTEKRVRERCSRRGDGRWVLKDAEKLDWGNRMEGEGRDHGQAVSHTVPRHVGKKAWPVWGWAGGPCGYRMTHDVEGRRWTKAGKCKGPTVEGFEP